MTAIERTAYPTFDSHPLTQNEVDDFYTPTKEELRFVHKKLRRSPEKRKLSSTVYEQHCLKKVEE